MIPKFSDSLPQKGANLSSSHTVSGEYQYLLNISMSACKSGQIYKLRENNVSTAKKITMPLNPCTQIACASLDLRLLSVMDETI